MLEIPQAFVRQPLLNQTGDFLSDDLVVMRRKKRGRHLQSDDLEKFLIEKIRSECLPHDIAPDRIWVVSQAKQFMGKNNVELKCSKGWLDKFMKRNSSLINLWKDK